MFKKTIAIIILLAVSSSMFSVCFMSSAKNIEAPIKEITIDRYQVIATHTSGINIIGLSAECNASMGAQYSTSLSITMELQKLSSGSYSTIKTWTKSKTGTSIELEGSKVVNILNSYRLKTTFTAGNETVVVFSYP